VRLNFVFFFIFQNPSLATMSYHPPFSSSSDEVRDEDNHPELRHWYERSPPKPPKKRSQRGRGGRGGGGERTANRSDFDCPKELTNVFIHNPDLNGVVILRTETWSEKQERLEARLEACEARRDAAKKRRAEAEAGREREAHREARSTWPKWWRGGRTGSQLGGGHRRAGSRPASRRRGWLLDRRHG
jgi:hypothetical protein